ncbi:3'-5' exonuclease [Thioflexithrix psekupsensis]|uniref:3'-5' exonuclease n=2 Tax=Thioflexithrix psekupsensis TaxID=1570016 RepID=A0A251X582_9GAMM|nr:3'-5' exonuclease [Thioflexithrix psekupsensis]
MNVLVFDIETVPDVASGRQLYGDPLEMAQLSDEDVARVMSHYRYQETEGQSEFLRLHLQRVVAISIVLRSGDQFKVWSLGEAESSEPELIHRFFEGLQKYKPTLVSWNGTAFDLPVLHYRSLLHGVSAPLYWTTENTSDGHFRWNNYLNRYHERHIDLMDMLANYQARAYVSLEQMAILLGLPGKMGMSGHKVWDTYLEKGLQGIEEIRHYCETDVLNTYLIYLRFELIRGHLTPETYAQECQRVKTALQAENKPHLNEFLQLWTQRQHTIKPS